MKKLVWILVLLTISKCWGQHSIDSLTSVLKNQPKDTVYLNALNELGFQYLLQRPSEALPSINQALALADSLNHPKGLFRATLNKGSAYWTIGLPDLALKYYLEAESILVPTNPHYNAALYNNMGEVFKKKNQLDSSLPYYRKGIRINENAGKTSTMLIYNLGEAFFLLDNIDSAKHYFIKSYANAKKEAHLRGEAYALTGLAELDYRNESFKECLMNFQSALRIRKMIKDNRGLIMSYLRISNVYSKMDNIGLCKMYLDSASSLSEIIKAHDLRSATYAALAEFHKNTNDFNKAFEFLDLHYQLKDSLSSNVFIQSIDQMKSALISEIQQTENKLLKEKQELQRKRTQAQIFLISGVAFTLLIFGLFLHQRKLRMSAISSTKNNRKIIETLQEVSKIGIPYGFATFLKEVLSLSAETLNVERAIYWEASPANNHLVVTAFYTANSETPDLTGYSTHKDKFKKYFEALIRDKVLAVEDTNRDKLIAEFDKEYLKKNRIRSLMDVEIRSERTFIGVLSFEQTNSTRTWSLSDQRFASSLSNIISSAYLLEENKNLLVELLVKQQRLRDSTFTLSHNIREPLSQILGFTELKLKDKNEADKIWKHLDQAAKQIDKVIRELTNQLVKDQNQ